MLEEEYLEVIRKEKAARKAARREQRKLGKLGKDSLAQSSVSADPGASELAARSTASDAAQSGEDAGKLGSPLVKPSDSDRPGRPIVLALRALGRDGKQASSPDRASTGERKNPDGPFAQAASRVLRRLDLIHFVRAVRKSAVPFSLLALGLFLAFRLSGYLWMDWIGALLMIVIWLASCGVWVWRHKPSEFSALSFWDSVANRGDSFASAHFFEQKSHATQGEELHLLRASRQLEQELPKLGNQIPMPRVTWHWVLPLVVFVFTLTPWLKRELGAADRELDAVRLAIARQEGEDLADREKEEDFTALSKKEKEQMKALNKSIDKAAEKLKNAEGSTLKEIFKELSDNANAAEEMAKSMEELGNDGWLSDQMIEAMIGQADTAEFGQQVKDKSAATAADEADLIADRLESDKLTNQIRERVNDALFRIMKKATSSDRKRMIGRHFAAASEKMRVARAKPAAREFREIAKKLRRQAEREKVAEKLLELAKKLKDKGAKIANQNAREMRNKGKLAQNLKSLKNMAPRPAGLDPMNMRPQNNLRMPQMMPAPGQLNPPPPGQMQPGQKGQQQGKAPVPGMGQPWRPGMKKPKLIPGQGKPNGNNGPMQWGNGNQPGGGAAVPVPGAGGGNNPGGLLGGLDAGSGTTGLGNEPTKLTDAANSGTVVTDINETGESSMRAVAGGETTDTAAREYLGQARDFLKVEEAALDGKALPASRRTQVRRYFNAIRQLLEDDD